MAACFLFRAEEDEASFWSYDSTWEEDEEEEEEDGGGAEAAGGEEPVRGSSQAQGPYYKATLKTTTKKRPTDVLRTAGAKAKFVAAVLERFSGMRNWNAAKDLQRYRRHYPDLVESEDVEEEEMWNLSFYKNEIRFVPHGLHIENLLESWWDNYEVLEENHSYIQWLFPLRERGMNCCARRLTTQEIQAFKKSKEVMQRFIRAYQLMLRFYGIILTNEETGELKKAENWAERFQNLNRFSHNNLRITRILKCLGEMGYEHYQVHLVKFFLTETLVKETLPNVRRSALDYFLFTVRSKRSRRELVHYAWQHFKPQDSFVWGPHDKLSAYRARPTRSQPLRRAGDEQGTPGKKPDGSVEKDENQSEAEVNNAEAEQKAGDAADLQHEVNDEDVKEKFSKCVLKGGDGEEEKEASFTQQEEKDLSSETEEVQGTTENDGTKESKKRKLDANMADARRGPLKSPPDIENISRNLGECAIGAGIPSVPHSQAEEDQGTLKEDNTSTKDSRTPETADAAVKRRKVDGRSKAFSLAINLTMEPSASSSKLNPSVANTEAGKENGSEEIAAVEVTGEKNGGDANGEAGGAWNQPGVPKTGRTSPVSDGLESSGDQSTDRNDQHCCNSTLLGGKREADEVEQRTEAEHESEEGQAEDTGEKQVLKSLKQAVDSTCPEEDSAEAAAQKPDSSERAAGPEEEQVAAE